MDKYRYYEYQYDKMSRDCERTLIIVGILTIIALIIVFSILLTHHDLDDYTTEKYVVQSGDTLWNIAEEYKPDWMDIRQYIDLIEEDNNTSAMINPGQRLKLRIYED